MTTWNKIEMYAIRASSKGWSDIIATCGTQEEAEAYCKQMYKLAETSAPKTNFHVEVIYYYYNRTTTDEETLPF